MPETVWKFVTVHGLRALRVQKNDEFKHAVLFVPSCSIKPGITHGATDEFGYNVTENGVHVHDFNASLLHLMGIDHERLTCQYQGRRFRLMDVHGEVLESIIA